jgi:hypothetical protein
VSEITRKMEVRLHQVLSQGVLDLLDFVRYRVPLMPGINYPAYQLKVVIDNQQVEVLIGVDNNGSILIAKWPDRMLETFYLLQGDYLHVELLEEAAQVLDTTATEICRLAANWSELNESQVENKLRDAIKIIAGGSVRQQKEVEEIQQKIAGQPTTGTGNGTVGVGTGVDNFTAAEREKQSGIIAQVLALEEEAHPHVGDH